MYEEIFNEKLTVGTFDGEEKNEIIGLTHACLLLQKFIRTFQILSKKFFLDDNAVTIKQEAIKHKLISEFRKLRCTVGNCWIPL